MRVGDSPDKRHEIGKELVEQRNTLRSLGSHTKRTSLSLRIVRINGRTRVGTIRQRLRDKVCVQNRRAIVREALAGLYEGNGVHGPLDLSRDTTQRLELLLGRELIVRV